MRVFPGSLSGQIALLMGSALLIASAVNFGLLWAERSRIGLIAASGPAIARFVDLTTEIESDLPDRRQLSFGRGGMRFMVGPNSMVDVRGLPRNERLEERLTSAFQDAGGPAPDVRAATAIVERPPRMRPDGPRGPNPAEGYDVRLREGREVIRGREIVLSAALSDGRWINGVFFGPGPPRGEIIRLGAFTFITFVFVLGAALWISGRLSRPLRDLSAAALQVGASGEPQEVAVSGPNDVRRTLEAFNAMSRRVTQLLNEKDVMLGALGHDLRTPLASLRIRIESMEPESERLKAIRTIEEAAQLLEDILELARHGRSNEPVRTVDLSVLVQDIVEDYAETGAPVTLEMTEKAPATCRPVLLRRALRNLVDNAIVYGDRARVSVSRSGGDILVQIEDDGPGMTADALASARQPFVRGETSRSRTSGGAGLGLTLAEAIVRAHGGSLQLENRSPRGLRATLRLPATPLPVS